MVDRPASISLEEFKARLPLVEVVGRHVRLTRRGRELIGLCPFHREKTPSFTVSETKGFFHCFGCGQHGTAIDFVMAIEGLDFAAALHRLAELTGLPVPQGRGDAAPDRGLLAANQAAATWFRGCLEGTTGAAARAYLERRRVDAAAADRYALGYAPDDRGALRRALRAEGYDEAQLVAAGLLVQPDDGPAYDRFRDRLMFPIQDVRGRVVGFGGRALGEARAKYLNTPETDLFHKGELLYGLPLARQAARERGTVVVAEGYMDVIALHRAGFANAVAPLGTAVTEAQLGLLWQLADEPVICLDGDEAGLRAGRRLIERAMPLLRPGKSLRFALLPEGRDPDDVLRLWGRETLAHALEGARPLADFLFDSELRRRPADTPERRAALRQGLLDLARTVPDPHLGRLFREAFERRLEGRFGASRRRRGQAPTSPIPRHERGEGVARMAAALAGQELAAEAPLLGIVLARPELLHEVEEELAGLTFAQPELEQLRQQIVAWYSETGHLDPQNLSNHLCKNGFAAAIERLEGKLPAGVDHRRAADNLACALEHWRSGLALYHQARARRSAREAVADAIADGRDDAARAYRLVVDRLINPEHQPATAGGERKG